MSSLAMSGVFSGIETDVLIARSMAFNRMPLNRLEASKATWQVKDLAVADLESRLAVFKSQVDSLRSSDTLERMRGTSLDTDVLSASASASAIEGSYVIEVNQLATAHRLVHTTGLAETDTRVGVSTSAARNVNGVADADAVWFTTSTNGATYTFDFGDQADIDAVALGVSTGYSMNQVAALINVRSQAVSGYDAAAVVEDSGQYYLELTAEELGPIGELTHALTGGDAIAEFADEADWTKTDGQGGAFVYTYDGVTRTLNTGSGTTLTDLVDLINNDAGNPGVTASLLEYNSTYHLSLGARETGSAYAITIDDGATTLVGLDTSDFTETQQARDAQIKVDGFPPGGEDWIERSSNTVSDVIPNVTIGLRTTGTTTITVARDTEPLRSDLSNLAAVYNGLVDKIVELTGVNERTGSGGALRGDSTVSRLLDSLRSAIASPVAGFLSGSDPLTLAAEIGLEFGQTGDDGLPAFDEIGKLHLDESTLSDALASNYRAVLDLVGAVGTGSSDSNDIQFTSADESTEGGTYEVRVDFNASGAVMMAMVRREGQTAWRNLAIDGSELTGEDDTPEEGLKLTAVWDSGQGAYTEYADVRVRQGFAQLLYNRVDGLLDEVTGVIVGRRDHYDSAIATIDKNIEFQERLLVTKQKNLERKYARLELTLAKLDAQRGAFDSLFAALAANDNKE
jgi:flagellar hook-associated protein 2